MGFVDDNEIPSLLPDTLAHVFLFGVIDGSDDLRRPLPWIGQLLLVNCRKDYVERLPKPSEHLILPLNSERSGT